LAEGDARKFGMTPYAVVQGADSEPDPKGSANRKCQLGRFASNDSDHCEYGYPDQSGWHHHEQAKNLSHLFFLSSEELLYIIFFFDHKVNKLIKIKTLFNDFYIFAIVILNNMTKNPLVNALAAALYIVAVVSVMNLARIFVKEEDMLLIPIAMLSLFVLSAAVMGFLFFFQPVQLYLDGERSRAVNLFLKTLATFAAITALLFLVLFWLA
jgi:hypothetical protein